MLWVPLKRLAWVSIKVWHDNSTEGLFCCDGRTTKSWAQQWLHGLFSQMNNFRRFGKPSMWLVLNPFLIEFVNSCLSATRCRSWSFVAVSDFHSPGASAAAPGWTQDTSQQDSLHFKTVCLASAHFPDLVFYNIYFSFFFFLPSFAYMRQIWLQQDVSHPFHEALGARMHNRPPSVSPRLLNF